MSTAFKREDEDNKIDPKRMIILSVEGDETERTYFQHLNTHLDRTMIQIEVLRHISIYDLFGYAGEAVGLATVIMAAYERWLWRINPFETTPALKKIYTGKIVSSYDNIERPIELYIKQSLLPVQITMVSAESRSNSLSASVTGINGENSLIYHYLNTPQSKYRDRSEVHYGTAVLTIIDGTMLKGRYYTDRKTNGDIELIVKE